MQHRFIRLIVTITLVASALLVTLSLPPSATPAAVAAGAGPYSTPEWWPLRGSNLIGCTTRSPGTVCGGTHHSVNAIDIEGPRGQAVYAAGAGLATVLSSSATCSGYGVTVVVDHGPYGKTLYAHLNGFAAALTSSPGGLWVDQNTVIGYLGHTGSVSDCTYNHLHFEYSSTGSWGSGASLIPDLKGCVGTESRTYPDTFGQTSWVELPGHTYRAESGGTDCSGGAPLGSLDAQAGTLGGFAQVRGWTLDPDDRLRSTEVHVYVDGAAGSGVAKTVLPANRARPDVAWSYPGAGEGHGFHGAVSGLTPGTHTLHVYAANATGTPGADTLLGTPTITVPPPTAGMPYGSVDGTSGRFFGEAHVRGWAIDPEVPTSTIQVQVYIDGPSTSGAPSVLLDTGVSRPDVPNVFPGVGDLHGFESIIGQIEPGIRNLWFYAVNNVGPAGNPLLGVRAVTVKGDPCTGDSPVRSFTDVPPAHTFCRDIEWMHQDGIDDGYPNGTYAPFAPNTRAMTADQLYNFAGRPAFSPPAGSRFTDVPPDHPLYVQISWLASTGITTGYDDNTFRPDEPVSRQAMAAFFYRMAGEPAAAPAGGVVMLPFSDVPQGHRFHDEIAYLAATGITRGYEDGTFRPAELITRQAMAAFIHRYSAL